MTNERPNVSPSSRYNESEAARLLGANRMGIKSGRVYYKGTEIERAWAAH